MALADILSAIDREASDEIFRIAGHAREEAAGILRRAREEASHVKAREASERDRAIRVEAGRRAAEARRVAAEILRRGREEVFQEAMAEARRVLASAREAQGYPAIFAALAGEAVAALGGCDRLEVDPEDVQLAAAFLAERGLSTPIDATLRTAGGVVAHAADGRDAPNTLERRLERAEPYLRAIVASAIGRGMEE